MQIIFTWFFFPSDFCQGPLAHLQPKSGLGNLTSTDLQIFGRKSCCNFLPPPIHVILTLCVNWVHIHASVLYFWMIFCTSLFLHFTDPEFICEWKCAKITKKNPTVASDLLRGLVCVPPPTTMTALVLSRGVDQRAQTPTSRCSRRDGSCSVQPSRARSTLHSAQRTHHTASVSWSRPCGTLPSGLTSPQLLFNLNNMSKRLLRGFNSQIVWKQASKDGGYTFQSNAKNDNYRSLGFQIEVMFLTQLIVGLLNHNIFLDFLITTYFLTFKSPHSFGLLNHYIFLD